MVNGRPRIPCRAPGCPDTAPGGEVGRCERHRRAKSLSYDEGYDRRWQSARRSFLASDGNQICRLCGAVAQVADHHPRSRKQLVRAGVLDPDDHAYLRPLCRRCHDRHTGHAQPGGWAQEVV